MRYYLPAIFWALAITLVSSIPNLTAPGENITLNDKLAHFTEYFILSAALAHGIIRAGRSRGILIPTVLICIAFGAIDELHQSFVPGRTMELLDLLADSVGAVCGAEFLIILKNRISRMGGRPLRSEKIK